jgi:GNAT superfamily N-acetyltransferase
VLGPSGADAATFAPIVFHAPVTQCCAMSLDSTLVRGSETNARARRMWACPVHALLRPFGYLEFTDVYSMDLHADLPEVSLKPGYVISQAASADIDEIVANLPRDEPGGVLQMLFAQGHHCFVAKHRGRIVAYNWVAFREVQEEEYRCSPAPNEAICLNAYTAPEHRGKGLHSALLLSMLHFAKSEGKTVAYTAVSLLNETSWKTHVRMGWRLAFTISYFRPNFTIRRRPWVLKPGKPPVELDWSRHSWIAAVR